MLGFAAPPLDSVRVAIFGIGSRGKSAVVRLKNIPFVTITTVCDLREMETKWATDVLKAAKKPAPLEISGDENAWRRAFEQKIDLAYICTPWNWHAPMGIASMEAGAHAAIEVPIATTIEDCWRLVRVSEATRRHCTMLENVCFGETEMALTAMCKGGVFGELLHGEAAYLHDLRAMLLGEDKRLYPKGWRLEHSIKRNGNLYPTHGLGPVCQYMDIGGADRLQSLVSMSSRTASIVAHAKKTFGEGSPEAGLDVRQGDVNTTIIKTKLGRTIMLQFSTMTPRPYSRLNLVQGTKGIFAGFPDRMALDPEPHTWSSELWQEHLKRYRAPDWVAFRNETGDQSGDDHGGMDTIMDRRLIASLRKGQPLDIDLYSSVLWSAIGPLAEQSVANGGAPVQIPDFAAMA